MNGKLYNKIIPAKKPGIFWKILLINYLLKLLLKSLQSFAVITILDTWVSYMVDLLKILRINLPSPPM